MEKKSARQAAIEVLKRARGPLATKELAKRTLETEGVKLGGKTPEATIAAMLATSNKTGGPFVRTAPGTYGLRDEVAEPEPEKGGDDEPAEQPAEPTQEPPAEPESEPDEHSASLKEAAAAADRKSGNKRQAKPHPKPSAKERGRAKATA